MDVVIEVVEKVFGTIWGTLAVPFVACQVLSLSGETIYQNLEVIECQNEIFLLINILEFCHDHI